MGVCTPGHNSDMNDVITVGGRRIPVLGDEHDVTRALDVVGADTVAVTATEQSRAWTECANLAWDLEGKRVDLVVSPGILDVSRAPGFRCDPLQAFR